MQITFHLPLEVSWLLYCCSAIFPVSAAVRVVLIYTWC